MRPMRARSAKRTVRDEFDVLDSARNRLRRHPGAWVAVVGDRVVAIGETAKEVCEKALREHPGVEPFVMRLPKEKVMLL